MRVILRPETSQKSRLDETAITTHRLWRLFAEYPRNSSAVRTVAEGAKSHKEIGTGGEQAANTERPCKLVRILRLPSPIGVLLPVQSKPDGRRGPQTERWARPQPTWAGEEGLHEVSCG